ncbi:MAG: Molybdopterin molybdenumtransferase [Bacteroidota bacterium]|nr:MAG: Molybdopterin molybdenumtransferase [Bacteroidota bacterium]
MISVQNALEIIEKTSRNYGSETISLETAANRILSTTVYATINMPPFRQSAMDGYAIRQTTRVAFNVIGESKAGDANNFSLNADEAVRVFTGALVPDDADTVIMQEHVDSEGEKIQINTMPKKGANIRNTGEQISKGNLALAKGTRLNSAAIGFLACLGIAEVSVFTLPKVAIIVTGNELQEPGKNLPIGKIYESNASMLSAALGAIGILDVQFCKVEDDFTATKEAIASKLLENDVVLISGGISVGDYDFVRKALVELGVEELFYKVNQKPGKPLWFGKKDTTFVFGLPGNPASALTCFYVYVLPLLRDLGGYGKTGLEKVSAKANFSFHNKSGKTLFLKAYLENDSVDLLDGQSSAMLHTYAKSNALACVDANTVNLSVGDIVECLKFDF